MNKIVIVLVAAAVCFTIVESLSCYSCSLGISTTCFFSNQVTCSTAQQCSIGTIKFTGTDVLSLIRKGCLSTSQCNMNSTSTLLPGLSYTSTQSCCSTNLCNSAGATSLSLLGALGMAVVWAVGLY
ncbi:sperm acrosome membrane-associated protein 4 [Amia ocellicauda]|uniref:sperm acrosome membrane-associated protein 4 n=1 Tax=Amia ocellicauda TaxID=2972642 RepID=UPI0034640B19